LFTKDMLPSEFSWMELNPDLEKALDLIRNTEDNLNIIGPSGTGKTTLLKLLTHKDFIPGNKVVLSSTGIAAVNASSEGIVGSTVHSFFKFKPLTIYTPNMLHLRNEIAEAINEVDILVIDEISMINASLFDFMIETLLYYRSKQYSNLPRIILFGDILQLPPVIDTKSEGIKKYFDTLYSGNYMYFNSLSFSDYSFRTVHLNTIYRQADSSFQNVLNRIRQGTQTNEDLAMINQYVIEESDFFDKNEMYLYIATTNRKVNEINEINLEVLKGKPYYYRGILSGDFDLSSKPVLQENIMLKEEAQIMCLVNHPFGFYQNGTLARVERCNHDSVDAITNKGKKIHIEKNTWKEYNYKYDSSAKSLDVKEIGSFIQIGAKPASALSVWKTQGQTLDTAYIDFEHWTPEATCYVALSRLRSLEGLGLKRAITHKDIKVSKESLAFLETI